jgi:hypothetical protein
VICTFCFFCCCCFWFTVSDYILASFKYQLMALQMLNEQ